MWFIGFVRESISATFMGIIKHWTLLKEYSIFCATQIDRILLHMKHCRKRLINWLLMFSKYHDCCGHQNGKQVMRQKNETFYKKKYYIFITSNGGHVVNEVLTYCNSFHYCCALPLTKSATKFMSWIKTERTHIYFKAASTPEPIWYLSCGQKESIIRQKEEVRECSSNRSNIK